MLLAAGEAEDAPSAQPDPLAQCRTGYEQVAAKHYNDAIAALEQCTSILTLSSTQSASAYYLRIVALFCAGSYDEAGRLMDVRLPSMRPHLSAEMVQFLEQLQGKLRRDEPPLIVTTSITPTMSDDSVAHGKDLAKMKARQQRESEPRTDRLTLEEAIAQSGDVAGQGPEATQRLLRDAFNGSPYTLQPDANTEGLQPPLPTSVLWAAPKR